MRSVTRYISSTLITVYNPDGKTIAYDKSKRIAVGWQDALVLAECAKTGFTHFALTKLDALDGFDEIKIATAYKYEGDQELNPSIYEVEEHDEATFIRSYVKDPKVLKHCTPIYETLPGWASELKKRGLASISEIKKFEDLPAAAQNYVKRIEEILGRPIVFVSVGPKKDQYIERKY